MINEFFCWLTGHQSFSGALGTKIYKRQGRRFIYTGMDYYSCKCCNKRFIKAEGVKAVLESATDLLTETLPITEGNMRRNIKGAVAEVE